MERQERQEKELTRILEENQENEQLDPNSTILPVVSQSSSIRTNTDQVIEEHASQTSEKSIPPPKDTINSNVSQELDVQEPTIIGTPEHESTQLEHPKQPNSNSNRTTQRNSNVKQKPSREENAQNKGNNRNLHQKSNSATSNKSNKQPKSARFVNPLLKPKEDKSNRPKGRADRNAKNSEQNKLDLILQSIQAQGQELKSLKTGLESLKTDFDNFDAKTSSTSRSKSSSRRSNPHSNRHSNRNSNHGRNQSFTSGKNLTDLIEVSSGIRTSTWVESVAKKGKDYPSSNDSFEFEDLSNFDQIDKNRNSGDKHIDIVNMKRERNLLDRTAYIDETTQATNKCNFSHNLDIHLSIINMSVSRTKKALEAQNVMEYIQRNFNTFTVGEDILHLLRFDYFEKMRSYGLSPLITLTSTVHLFPSHLTNDINEVLKRYLGGYAEAEMFYVKLEQKLGDPRTQLRQIRNMSSKLGKLKGSLLSAETARDKYMLKIAEAVTDAPDMINVKPTYNPDDIEKIEHYVLRILDYIKLERVRKNFDDDFNLNTYRDRTDMVTIAIEQIKAAGERTLANDLRKDRTLCLILLGKMPRDKYPTLDEIFKLFQICAFQNKAVNLDSNQQHTTRTATSRYQEVKTVNLKVSPYKRKETKPKSDELKGFRYRYGEKAKNPKLEAKRKEDRQRFNKSFKPARTYLLEKLDVKEDEIDSTLHSFNITYYEKEEFDIQKEIASQFDEDDSEEEEEEEKEMNLACNAVIDCSPHLPVWDVEILNSNNSDQHHEIEKSIMDTCSSLGLIDHQCAYRHRLLEKAEYLEDPITVGTASGQVTIKRGIKLSLKVGSLKLEPTIYGLLPKSKPMPFSIIVGLPTLEKIGLSQCVDQFMNRKTGLNEGSTLETFLSRFETLLVRLETSNLKFLENLKSNSEPPYNHKVKPKQKVETIVKINDTEIKNKSSTNQPLELPTTTTAYNASSNHQSTQTNLTTHSELETHKASNQMINSNITTDSLTSTSSPLNRDISRSWQCNFVTTTAPDQVHKPLISSGSSPKQDKSWIYANTGPFKLPEDYEDTNNNLKEYINYLNIFGEFSTTPSNFRTNYFTRQFDDDKFDFMVTKEKSNLLQIPFDRVSKELETVLTTKRTKFKKENKSTAAANVFNTLLIDSINSNIASDSPSALEQRCAENDRQFYNNYTADLSPKQLLCFALLMSCVNKGEIGQFKDDDINSIKRKLSHQKFFNANSQDNTIFHEIDELDKKQIHLPLRIELKSLYDVKIRPHGHALIKVKIPQINPTHIYSVDRMLLPQKDSTVETHQRLISTNTDTNLIFIMNTSNNLCSIKKGTPVVSAVLTKQLSTKILDDVNDNKVKCTHNLTDQKLITVCKRVEEFTKRSIFSGLPKPKNESKPYKLEIKPEWSDERRREVLKHFLHHHSHLAPVKIDNSNESSSPKAKTSKLEAPLVKTEQSKIELDTSVINQSKTKLDTTELKEKVTTSNLEKANPTRKEVIYLAWITSYLNNLENKVPSNPSPSNLVKLDNSNNNEKPSNLVNLENLSSNKHLNKVVNFSTSVSNSFTSSKLDQKVKTAKLKPSIIPAEYQDIIPDCSSDDVKVLESISRQEREKLLQQFEIFELTRRKEFLDKLKGVKDSRIASVFTEFSDIFSGDKEDSWKYIKAKPIKIPLQTDIPEKCLPQYKKKLTEIERQVCEDFLMTNLARGLIKKSNTNYIAPLLIVKKPNNRGYRVCCDLRLLNQKVYENDSHPIPDISEIVLTIGRAKIFSAFDLSNAYWRARVSKESQRYLGFSMPEGPFRGTYQFTVLPFGVKNAVSIFSKIMDQSFRGLQSYGTCWYLDDIVVSSCHGEREYTHDEIVETHCKDLRRMFGRARENGFSFSIEKADLMLNSINYLGFRIGNSQIEVSQKTKNNLDKFVEAATIDASEKTYQRIFGFFNYSSKFIPGFATKRTQVKHLRKEFSDFREENKYNFKLISQKRDELQVKLDRIILTCCHYIKETILHLPEKNTKLLLYTDASATQIGYILYTNDHRLIEMHSRVLDKAERNYTIQQKELLSAAQALERIKNYAARSSRVHLFIDNVNDVRTLSSCKTPLKTREIRLLAKFRAYSDVDVSYIKSESNPSDTLTRDNVFDLNENHSEDLRARIEKALASGQLGAYSVQIVNPVGDSSDSNETLLSAMDNRISSELEKDVQNKLDKPKDTISNLVNLDHVVPILIKLNKDSNPVTPDPKKSIKFDENKPERSNLVPKELDNLSSQSNLQQNNAKLDQNTFPSSIPSNFKPLPEPQPTKQQFRHPASDELDPNSKINLWINDQLPKFRSLRNQIKETKKRVKKLNEFENQVWVVSNSGLELNPLSEDDLKEKEYQNYLVTRRKNYENEVEVFLEKQEEATDKSKAELDSDRYREIKSSKSNLSLEDKVYIINLTHRLNMHIGGKKTYRQITLQYPQFKITQELVNQTVKKCLICQEYRKLLPSSKIGALPIPNRPGQTLSIDHVQLSSHESYGFKYCLSIKDDFSKYINVIPTRTKTISEVIQLLQAHFNATSNPLNIRADNAFRSTLFQRFSVELSK